MNFQGVLGQLSKCHFTSLSAHSVLIDLDLLSSKGALNLSSETSERDGEEEECRKKTAGHGGMEAALYMLLVMINRSECLGFWIGPSWIAGEKESFRDKF